MRSIFYLFIFVLISFSLSACSIQPASPEDEAAAKHYLQLLQEKNFSAIENDIDPSVNEPNIQDILTNMAQEFPKQTPISVKVVDSRVSTNKNGTMNVNVVFEYQFPYRWMTADVAMKKRDSFSTLVGIHVEQMADSLEHYNKFSLFDKSLKHFVVLLFAIVVPVFICYTLRVCLKTDIKKRKWLWIFFIAMGIGRCTINWSTGQVILNLGYLQLFGAGIAATTYGPVSVWFSLPLGAFAFLIYRKRMMTTKA